MLKFITKSILCTISFVLSWGVHIQKNNITPTTSWYYEQHRTTRKFDPVNCRFDYLMYEEGCP